MMHDVKCFESDIPFLFSGTIYLCMYDKVTIPINEFSFSLSHSFCVMFNIYCSEEMNRVVELSRWKGVSVNMAVNFAALQWQKLQSAYMF